MAKQESSTNSNNQNQNQTNTNPQEAVSRPNTTSSIRTFNKTDKKNYSKKNKE